MCALCPLHLTSTCVHPASRYLLRPLCPHHHCRSWRTPPHQRTSEMSAWPCALTVKPGDCDTGRASMPTATLETQLFSPVGPTPQPPLSGAAPPIRGWLSHSWRQCKTYSSRQGRDRLWSCRSSVTSSPTIQPHSVHSGSRLPVSPPAAGVAPPRDYSPPTYKNASCDHAPTPQPLVRPSYSDVAR